MEARSGSDFPAYSEAIELGYEPYSNRSMEALSSDEVQCLIERLQSLRPGGDSTALVTHQEVNAPF